MPRNAIKAALQTQRLVALLILHLLDQQEELTEAELRRRIIAFSGGTFWRPGKGTVSEVVRDLLGNQAVGGEWRDPEGRRFRPLRLTPEGRQRLRVLREQLREPVTAGRRFFNKLSRELYDRHQ
jgi:DNA-binding PadR family transcriptional regulator